MSAGRDAWFRGQRAGKRRWRPIECVFARQRRGVQGRENATWVLARPQRMGLKRRRAVVAGSRQDKFRARGAYRQHRAEVRRHKRRRRAARILGAEIKHATDASRVPRAALFSHAVSCPSLLLCGWPKLSRPYCGSTCRYTIDTRQPRLLRLVKTRAQNGPLRPHA